MRFPTLLPFSLILLMIAAAGSAREIDHFPYWDGAESITDYAARTHLSPTQTQNLGNGAKLDLVLIPAGKFVMGTPDPLPVNEKAFEDQITIGKALFEASAGVLLALLLFSLIRAVKEKHRPQLSLRRMLLVTVTAGGGVLGWMHWQHSGQAYKQAQDHYTVWAQRSINVRPSEKPAHPVTLTQPFYLSQFAVTQQQYEAVMGKNPSQRKGKDLPVNTVTWNDAQEFCKKLSTQTQRTVRLPTEAEWEFACRAGTETRYSSGDSWEDLQRVAWTCIAPPHQPLMPVGLKAPNPWGLYDMHGNVGEWCSDFFGEKYYEQSPLHDPQGPKEGSEHVVRGAGKVSAGARSAMRSSWGERPFTAIGFRVVFTMPEEKPVRER